MLFLRSWLQEYIDLSSYSDSELKNLITMKSGEVDEVIEVEDYFSGKILIGKIFNTQKHPDADRLKVFQIDLGVYGQIQIVSAALNVRDGIIVPVATVGTRLPMGIILERKMRGELSQGMCLGKSELMLETQDSEGLWELDDLLLEQGLVEEKYLGKSVCEVLPGHFPKETVFDIKYLADKIASCGNHLGLALDISICLENKNLLTPLAKNLLDPVFLMEQIINKVEIANSSDLKVNLQNDSNYLNSYFLFDLEIKDEYRLPHDFQKRMFLTSRNTVGGLADLSNYLLADMGQPTHFFSKAKVLGLNENIALDWKIEKLAENTKFQGLGQLKNTVIPNDVAVLIQGSEILAIPGLSGGDRTKLEPTETQTLVEIANFPAEIIAKSSFSLNYRSDSSKIWAGGIKKILQIICLVRLLQSLSKESKVKVLLNSTDGNHLPVENFLKVLENIISGAKKTLHVDLQYIVNRLDGKSIEYWKPILTEKLNLLGSFKFETEYTGTLELLEFYGEINTLEDLLEQLARLIGFTNLNEDYLEFSNEKLRSSEYDNLMEVKKLFTQYGFSEIISRPFISTEQMNNPASETKLINAYNSNQPFLRDSFIPTLFNALENNILRGEKNIKLFEFGKLYFAADSKLFEELILDGLVITEDPYLLTSIIDEFSRKIVISPSIDSKLPDYVAAFGKGYYYTFKEGVDATIIKINNSIKKKYNIPISKSVWFIGLALTGLPVNLLKYKKYYNESEFPSISRNYSVVLPVNINWKQIESFIVDNSLENVNIRPKPLERIHKDGQEILNFEVSFVSYVTTLDSKQIQQWEEKFFKSLTGLGEIKLR